MNESVPKQGESDEEDSARSELAPVVLFVYNRLDHAERTIEALRANELASQTDLYIYSDGSREGEEEGVLRVRERLRGVNGFKSVSIIESAINIGLAENISRGVTEVCCRHGKVIVLEDDIKTHPKFLDFMNRMLNAYEGDDSVWHISGSSYPIDTSFLPDYYFLHLPLCWGWATNWRAWQHFRRDISVMREFSPKMVNEFNFDDSHDYWSQLLLNRSGDIRTWFIFWYAQLFLNRALAVFPSESLVENIGFDGTGEHCSNASSVMAPRIGWTGSLLDVPFPRARISETAYTEHIRFFRRIGPSRVRRIIREIKLWVKTRV